MKILYEEAKWKSIASALEKVNEAHEYDNKYEYADDLFKDSKSEIADKDIDRAISFSPQTYHPEAKPIREKYKKLYDYAKGIGKIIDEKVDEPFYKSINEYIQKMADMNATAYTTANTINVQTGPFFYRHDKKEIKLTDLYETDTEYSDNLKAEYEAWKLQNPDVKASQDDYETATLNSGAFEYEGIRAGQEKKEFWFNLIATGVVVGLTIVCPPAGLVAGAAYTAIDVGGAIRGEDLISGRKLSDNERLVRGAFAIVPGAGAAAGKALLKNMPALANVMKSAYKTVENGGGSALKSTLEHARNLGKAHGDQLKFTLKHPVLAAVTSKTGQQTVRESAKFIDNALRPIEVRAVQTTAGNVVTGVERGLPSGKLPAKADEYLAIKQVEKDGVLSGKGVDNKNTKDITKLTADDIPTAKSGTFNKFFNSLTSRELDELWKDKKIRKKIERQLREPGGLHEWHLVSRAPQFKYWNIGAEEIKNLRTAISDVKFINPNGIHGGLGSTKAHNELLAIIDTSSDYNTFVRRLNNWANYRLAGGDSSLPQGLRLK
ncbi:pre-toxin TG domain-containing protein [Rummeliibacillus sp. TYF-LIM-RU47]|uniref:pre-toxin TG domain-containing protein n=1 Tax=Rummeliibacillus sp. TYF-LIM-RU47 TaxID=2608406 RepID=UPI00123BD6B6|nr:pre-toxin TG domain-containing protein [Rummeliibacillus sp. TYF-LIM-RU47]